MEYTLYEHEVEVIKSALNAHINQCERFLNEGIIGSLTADEKEKVISKVTRMKDLKNMFESLEQLN